jgi:hypothetical protein
MVFADGQPRHYKCATAVENAAIWASMHGISPVKLPSENGNLDKSAMCTSYTVVAIVSVLVMVDVP